MKNLITLLRKDLLALWRTKKILILGLVFLIFALSSPVFAYYMPEILKMAALNIPIEIPAPTIFDSYQQLFSNLGQIGLFVLIILFVPEIVNERKKGQLTILLNNSVTKSEFILSKVISQILIFSLIFLFSVACFGFYNFILFGEAFGAHALLSLTLLYVYFLFAISLCNFFSSISKTMTIAMILTFAVTVFMSVFNLFKFGKYLPSALSDLASSVLKSEEVTNAYQTMGITATLSVLLIFLAIKFCSNKD